MSLLSDGKALVASGDVKLVNLRSAYHSHFKRECKLTDNELIVAFMSTEDDLEGEQLAIWLEGFENFSDADWLELEDSGLTDPVDGQDDGKGEHTRDSTLVDQAIADPLKASAVDEARHISVATLTLMDETTDAKLKVDVLPARLGESLVADFGKPAIMGWPKPGSKKDDVKGTNLRFDRYSFKVPNEKGGTRTVNASFYGDMFDATSNGKAIAKQNALLAQAKNRDAGNGDMVTPKEYLELDDVQRNKRAAMFNQRRTFQIGQLRKATELIRQFDAINAMPKVGARYDYDFTYGTDGKVKTKLVRSGQKPITLHAKNPDPNGQLPYVESGWIPVSISTFLRYDVAKAIANGGTKGDLEATNARDTNKEKQKTSKTVPAIGNGDVKVFEGFMASITGFLQDKENYRLVMKTLEDPKTDDAFILTMGDCADDLEAIVSKIDRRYQALKHKQEADKAAAVEARNKAAA